MLKNSIQIKTGKDIVDAFSQTEPEMKFIFKECMLDDIDDSVKTGNIDFAFRIVQPLKPCEEAIAFYQEPLHFIPKNPFFIGSSIELNNIYPWRYEFRC